MTSPCKHKTAQLSSTQEQPRYEDQYQWTPQTKVHFVVCGRITSPKALICLYFFRVKCFLFPSLRIKMRIKGAKLIRMETVALYNL